MSRETFEYHWGKHHRAYVDNLNKQIVGTELDGMALEDIVVATYNKGDTLPAFNNVAQVSLKKQQQGWTVSLRRSSYNFFQTSNLFLHLINSFKPLTIAF
ncbi:hypothetical protein Syun_009685 [Stephania yunnanensis]|uniref:superoxide dismutase n=1 Tax=Stephania yunnanensis TaxID=152371 RepID=A0AAP0PSI5_9MAGN